MNNIMKTWAVTEMAMFENVMILSLMHDICPQDMVQFYTSEIVPIQKWHKDKNYRNWKNLPSETVLTICVLEYAEHQTANVEDLQVSATFQV